MIESFIFLFFLCGWLYEDTEHGCLIASLILLGLLALVVLGIVGFCMWIF